MKIGNINTSKKIFIIAEIGNNHEGNFELAQKMIEQAAAAGVDAVKFQTFIPEHISSGDQARLERLRGFKFSHDQFTKLSIIAKKMGLIFFSTPFDIESAKFLNTIQPVFKIASGDNNFYPLIDTVASFGKPIIVSTGSANLDLIQKVYELIIKTSKNKGLNPSLAFLHCVSSYPVPDNEANLASIIYLKKLFSNLVIGYSDHTLGIEAAVLSAIAGARIIEKHFTLDKNYSDFRDHHLSANPNEMRLLVERVRKAESMLGIEEKKPQICEKAMNIVGRRSIAAARDLPVGAKLKWSDFIWIRPGKGYPPGEENKLIGKKIIRELKIGQIILKSDFV
ncbi:N-acetylneuraminate synthase family protein [Candidatus Pelagibacter ubique]|nr:N-acetylneuraminate synthase family protein [Candidatus Pelagibacter ubique]